MRTFIDEYLMYINGLEIVPVEKVRIHFIFRNLLKIGGIGPTGNDDPDSSTTARCT